VLGAIGLEPCDLFTNAPSSDRIVATYPYVDETSEMIFEVVRYEPKSFRQRRPDGRGGWVWNLDGVRRVLYRLPELIAAKRVFIAEGEKDVETLRALGLVATTNSGGARKWRAEVAQYFKGKDVVILPDNDEPGRKHAEQVAANLFSVARSLKLILLPGLEDHGDVSDWRAKVGQHAKDLLLALVEDSPAWTPSAAQARASAAVSPEAPENLTDLGNARRLVALHGQDLRYCHAFGKWLVWDSTRWKLDATNEVTRRMFDVVRQMHDQAACETSRAQREALENWARKSESDGKICAAISLAQSQRELVITPDELDQQPWLLNCENGTLDLRTFELCPHRREDYLTQKAGALYDPNATCPTWDAFLNQITDGKLRLQAFLQRAVGYSLTGLTSEQCVFLLWGTGQNGKTTLLEAVRAVMGNYAQHAEFSTFLHVRNRSIRNDLAALRGARYVTAIEADPGERLSESTIKTVTGGDPITARFLHREFFTYRPTYKLFLAVNDKPQVRGMTKGTWRRIRLIPFTMPIPEEKQDRHFLDKLRPELSGILAWAVRGCAAWREPGLEPPPEVVEATEGYREEMDIVGAFLSECCVPERDAVVTARDLYSRYTAYCERTGERRLTQRDLGLMLAQRGHAMVRLGKTRTRAWRGLRLEACEGDATETEAVGYIPCVY